MSAKESRANELHVKDGAGLVLDRYPGERILIGSDVVITIVDCGSYARIGIKAPKETLILREELSRKGE